MADRLAGRVALVTGAGSGIGRAISLLFAEEGARVCCADLDGAAADATAARIVGAGGVARAARRDVSQGVQARAAIDAAIDAFGALHVLVSNAAYFAPSMPLAELDEAIWVRTFAVNVHAAFHLCKHACRHIERAGGGSIILTASQMARVGHAGDTAYCASKGALLTMAKSLALELARANIRVNTLSPGGTATEQMAREWGGLERAEREWGKAMHPLGRLGRPEELARAALFLASEESSFMTGADLLVDGGYTAQ
ncbi:MAG: glucose 1-dehydrogenase [Alphaproteobacteria bacterium]